MASKLINLWVIAMIVLFSIGVIEPMKKGFDSINNAINGINTIEKRIED